MKTGDVLKEWAKHEVRFLEEEGDGVKNEHGVYSYQSKDGSHFIALEYFLRHYRKWLVDNNIVKEIKP